MSATGANGLDRLRKRVTESVQRCRSQGLWGWFVRSGKIQWIRGGKSMRSTIWKCEQLWAGQLYNRMVFDTREEAEHFVVTMRQMEPDQIISIEAVEAGQLWN